MQMGEITWGMQISGRKKWVRNKKNRNSSHKTWKGEDKETVGWRNPDGMENEKPSYYLGLSFEVRIELQQKTDELCAFLDFTEKFPCYFGNLLKH